MENISESEFPGGPAGGTGDETVLDGIFFRLVRAIMFDEKPVPELDALPMAQLRLLMVVQHSPAPTMKDLSERLGISQSSVTKLADSLTRRGLVERHPDPNDRRVIRLRPSDTARRINEEAMARRHALFAAIWGSQSADQRRRVMEGLDILCHAAEAARSAQGRPMVPCGGPSGPASPGGDATAGPPPTRPVIDVMNRPVRGRR